MTYVTSLRERSKDVSVTYVTEERATDAPSPASFLNHDAHPPFEERFQVFRSGVLVVSFAWHGTLESPTRTLEEV